MAQEPKIAFIGAGSTVFMKNIVGDVLQRPDLANAYIALMDINPDRLEDSEIVARKVVQTLDVGASVTTHLDRREALDGADFVVTTFQVGGYDPCTITDFEVPKAYGLRRRHVIQHIVADIQYFAGRNAAALERFASDLKKESSRLGLSVQVGHHAQFGRES